MVFVQSNRVDEAITPLFWVPSEERNLYIVIHKNINKGYFITSRSYLNLGVPYGKLKGCTLDKLPVLSPISAIMSAVYNFERISCPLSFH